MNLSSTEYYGRDNGFIMPAQDEVTVLPKGLRKYLRRVAPLGRKLPDGVWRSVPSDDYAYDVYETNFRDELWVRRVDPSVFRLQVAIPPLLFGSVEKVLFNTQSSECGVYDFGSYGPALSIESADPSEIMSIHQVDDPVGFSHGLLLVSAILHEKLKRQKALRNHYVSVAM